MKNRSRKSSNLLFSLSEHFEQCRTFLIAFCGTVLVGMLIGCFSFAKFNKIFDFSAFSFLDGNVFFTKVNFFSYACKHFLKLFLLTAIVLLFGMNIYLFPLNLFCLGYLGYIVGANTSLMIIIFGFTGTFCMIFIYVPISLCICFLIVNFACVCEKNCFDNHKFGRFACKGKNNVIPMLSLLLTILALVFVLLLLEGLILPTSIKNIIGKI